MSVKARFYVNQIVRNAYDPGAAVVSLQASSRGPEVKEWASATPSGSVTMTIKNSPAAEFFVARLGQDVFLTFTDVEEDIKHPTPYSS